MRVHWSVTSSGHGMDHIENNSFVVRMYVCWPGFVHDSDHIGNTPANTLSIVGCAYFERCLETGLRVTIYTYTYSLVGYLAGSPLHGTVGEQNAEDIFM